MENETKLERTGNGLSRQGWSLACELLEEQGGVRAEYAAKIRLCLEGKPVDDVKVFCDGWLSGNGIPRAYPLQDDFRRYPYAFLKVPASVQIIIDDAAGALLYSFNMLQSGERVARWIREGHITRKQEGTIAGFESAEDRDAMLALPFVDALRLMMRRFAHLTQPERVAGLNTRWPASSSAHWGIHAHERAHCLAITNREPGA